MWRGTQPPPTRQYVSLLRWRARACPHPPTRRESLYSIKLFEYFNFGDNSCLKRQKKKINQISISCLLFTRTKSCSATSVRFPLSPKKKKKRKRTKKFHLFQYSRVIENLLETHPAWINWSFNLNLSSGFVFLLFFFFPTVNL